MLNRYIELKLPGYEICRKDKGMPDKEKPGILIPEEEVEKRIGEIGRQISDRYLGKNVHLVCVLKGGAFFMCELAKRIA